LPGKVRLGYPAGVLGLSPRAQLGWQAENGANVQGFGGQAKGGAEDETVRDKDVPVFELSVGAFEGPLDLLLHLIQEHELDILDLPISFITSKYLEYLGMMEALHLDVVSEYLVMAATLAHIKSKMLLPVAPTGQDDDGLEEMGDPREELVRRLLEYQKYKAAAEDLAGRGIAGRDIFTRGAPAEEAKGDAPLGGMTLFNLLDAFNRVLKRANAELSREITAERVTIGDRMSELLDLLREKKRIVFDELFEGYVTNYDLVVTFLAMLEMAKQKLIRMFQSDAYSPIYLEGAVADDQKLDFGDPDAQYETAAAPVPVSPLEAEPSDLADEDDAPHE
jgi:segregation and condensation protein A